MMSPAQSTPLSSVGQLLVAPHLSDADFVKMASFIANELGIQMPLAKKQMIAARLLRRLRSLGYSDYGTYFAYLHTPEGRASEAPLFVDLVTTHTTHFFRESAHFEVIRRRLLPLWLRDRSAESPIRVWSAACSTGEEPYSLAMVLESQRVAHGRFDFVVLATDVSEQAIACARRAVYPLASAAQIPEPLRGQYLTRSRDPEAALIRIAPALRSKVHFETLNFMSAEWPIARQLDLVMCRNALIYFGREQQARIIDKLCEHLAPGGHLILSHTESVASHHSRLRMLERSVFEYCPQGVQHGKRRSFSFRSPAASDATRRKGDS